MVSGRSGASGRNGKAKNRDGEPFSHQPFRSLERLLDVPKSQFSKPHIRPVSPASGDDHALFHEAMKEVHEIKEFRDLAVRKGETKPLRKPPHNDVLHELDDIVKGKGTVRLADTQEYVEWIHPRYRREILAELHGGRYSVQDYLDLHGFVLEEAERVVQDFIVKAKRRGFHCIKIIHGRGLRSPNGPVLKKAVIDLLSCRFRKYVIGFCTARSNDGGLGALYVLLK